MVEILSLPEQGELAVEEAGWGGSGGLRFAAPGASELSPAVSLSVVANGDQAWTGDFYGGHEDFSLVVLGVGVSVDPSLLVVASGVGYLVPAGHPADFAVVPLRPIRDVLVASDSGVVVLVGYTNLVAFGGQGELWASERLVWDGFTATRIGSGCVVVNGFDAPSDRDVEITLDLLSGEVLSRS